MPRKGLHSHTVYCDEVTHRAIKEEAEGSGLSISKYVLDRLGLGVVGEESRPRKEAKSRAKEAKAEGRFVIEGGKMVDRGPVKKPEQGGKMADREATEAVKKPMVSKRPANWNRMTMNERRTWRNEHAGS